MKIAVIGAGIVGASIAYHLAARGASVTVFDREGEAAGVTRKAFGWINVSHGEPGPYALLRQRAVAEWRRIDKELGPALSIDWCGAITWAADPIETERLSRKLSGSGLDSRLIDRAEIAQHEPNLMHPPAVASYVASEGSVDPIAANQALMRAAQHHGATLHIAEVEDIATDGASVTGLRTSRGHFSCDAVILAAGTDSRNLAGRLGIALAVEESPAVLLRFVQPHRLVQRILSCPQWEVRHAMDGSLWCAEDYVEGIDPKVIAARAASAIKAALRGCDALELASVDVGIRPIPSDGLPMVGFSRALSGLYLAIMHAGVTLAPAIGRLATSEILDSTSEPLLATCRPDR